MRTKRDQEDVEYLARVMAQGRMIGADWITIAGRIIDTDLPGMGYTITRDRQESDEHEAEDARELPADEAPRGRAARQGASADAEAPHEDRPREGDG